MVGATAEVPGVCVVLVVEGNIDGALDCGAVAVVLRVEVGAVVTSLAPNIEPEVDEDSAVFGAPNMLAAGFVVWPAPENSDGVLDVVDAAGWLVTGLAWESAWLPTKLVAGFWAP